MSHWGRFHLRHLCRIWDTSLRYEYKLNISIRDVFRPVSKNIKKQMSQMETSPMRHCYNLLYSISVIVKLYLSSKTFFFAMYSLVLYPLTSIISVELSLLKTIKSALYFNPGASMKVGCKQKPFICFACS